MRAVKMMVINVAVMRTSAVIFSQGVKCLVLDNVTRRMMTSSETTESSAILGNLLYIVP